MFCVAAVPHMLDATRLCFICCKFSRNFSGGRQHICWFSFSWWSQKFCTDGPPCYPCLEKNAAHCANLCAIVLENFHILNGTYLNECQCTQVPMTACGRKWNIAYPLISELRPRTYAITGLQHTSQHAALLTLTGKTLSKKRCTWDTKRGSTKKWFFGSRPKRNTNFAKKTPQKHKCLTQKCWIHWNETIHLQKPV